MTDTPTQPEPEEEPEWPEPGPDPEEEPAEGWAQEEPKGSKDEEEVGYEGER